MGRQLDFWPLRGPVVTFRRGFCLAGERMSHLFILFSDVLKVCACRCHWFCRAAKPQSTLYVIKTHQQTMIALPLGQKTEANKCLGWRKYKRGLQFGALWHSELVAKKQAQNVWLPGVQPPNPYAWIWRSGNHQHKLLSVSHIWKSWKSQTELELKGFSLLKGNLT